MRQGMVAQVFKIPAVGRSAEGRIRVARYGEPPAEKSLLGWFPRVENRDRFFLSQGANKSVECVKAGRTGFKIPSVGIRRWKNSWPVLW
jgi:hypothetical protein